MDFREKLQTLRKEKGYSQEQLADILGVSRQAVSKWESGTSYPETDKLIEISKLFHVSLDELLKNEISETKMTNTTLNSELENEFIKFHKKFSIMIGLGVVSCIISLIAATLVYDIFHSEIMQIILFFTFITIGVIIFIYYGTMYSRYENVDKLYREKYKNREVPIEFSKKFSVVISVAVALCILGIVLAGVISEFTSLDSIIATAFFLPISITVYMFIYYGMQYDIYSIKKPVDRNVADKAHAVVMIIATMVFLIVGFLWNAWHPGWIAFVVGGLICGIISVIANEGE